MCLSCCESIDKEGNLAARWGGEEFIVLFSNTSIEKCQFIVNEIRKKIEKNKVMFENYLINVTASFGLTEVKVNTDKDFLIGFKKADEALYLAKQNGRNRIEWLS
nr:GGDEF domain-containing protein [Sedimentibacter sp.]